MTGKQQPSSEHPSLTNWGSLSSLQSCCRVNRKNRRPYLFSVHLLGELFRLHDPLPCAAHGKLINRASTRQHYRRKPGPGDAAIAIGASVPLRTWGALPWRLGGTDFFLLFPLNRLCFCVISLFSDEPRRLVSLLLRRLWIPDSAGLWNRSTSCAAFLELPRPPLGAGYGSR